MGFAKKDIRANVKVKKALEAAVSGNGNSDGVIIDTKGYAGVMFAIYMQAITDGVYTPVIQEGDAANLSDAVAVDDMYLSGLEADAVVDANDELTTIGYLGKKRFVRLRITASAVTTGGTVTAMAILSNPTRGPITQGVGA